MFIVKKLEVVVQRIQPMQMSSCKTCTVKINCYFSMCGAMEVEWMDRTRGPQPLDCESNTLTITLLCHK